MSKRSRAKRADRRRPNPPTSGATLAPPTGRCLLCGGKPIGGGMWLAEGAARRLMGRRSVVYPLCIRCLSRPGTPARAEKVLLLAALGLPAEPHPDGPHAALLIGQKVGGGPLPSSPTIETCGVCDGAMWADADMTALCGRLGLDVLHVCDPCRVEATTAPARQEARS